MIDDQGEIDPAKTAAMEARLERLDVFSETIRKQRQLAIDARKQMGIEDQWQEDEDHYEAIDDTNRTTSSRIKPYDFGGTGTGPTRLPETTVTRSTVFVPMTRPYVDMASALISDLYLPTDDRNWDGEPTPVPELVEQVKDETPITAPATQAPMQPQAQPGMAQGMPPAGPQQAALPPAGAPAPKTVGDIAQAEIDKADKAWTKARSHIDDWLLDCGYNAEMRKLIKDMSRIGVGIMKGPFPKSKSSKAVVKTTDGYAIEIQEKIIPASKRVDPWRFFPDPSCGEDINNGSYVFEQDFITRSKLRDLSKLDTYIKSQIDKCIEEGPINATDGTKKSQSEKRSESDMYEIWYFEGQVEWDDLNDAGCTVDGEKGDVFHAVITMVNNRVIKAALSHLDSDEFTYDVAVWQRKSGLWIGDGVARQGRTPQRGVNAAVRNMMDNAGRSSRPHTVINRGAIAPGADSHTWYLKDGSDISQVQHAMMFFNVPSMQQELMNIVQYYSKMFEDSTGLPMMMQGQQGSAPETVGGMELLMSNASIVPRDIVRRIDDNITEKHIGRYYEYLMIHGEDDSEKGDFSIHARGSSALMERASQDQFLLQAMQYVANPEFNLDPELVMEELLRSKRINPQRLKMSEEKKKERASRQPMPAPQVQVAQIRAKADADKAKFLAQQEQQLAQIESQMAMQKLEYEQQHDQQAIEFVQANMLKIAQMRAEADRYRTDKDTDRDTIYVQAQQARDESQAHIELAKLQENARIADVKYQTELTKLSQARGISEDQLKSHLAEISAKLQLQERLSMADMAADIHKHRNPSPVIAPPTEPAGRASDGAAFQE